MENESAVNRGDKPVARMFLHFFPGDNVDNLRHSVKDHRRHKQLDEGEAKAAFVEAEKRHIVSMQEKANLMVDICLKNAMDIRESLAAKKKLDKAIDTIDYVRSSQCVAPAAGLAAKLIQPEKKEPAEVESDGFMEALKGTAKDDWKDTGPVQVATDQQETEDGPELVDGR